MTVFTLILLAVVQGLTEFLPVSSSGHLILAPEAAGFDDQGVLIDLMAHVGSLAAVLIYFRRDVGAVATGKFALLRGQITPGGRLALLIAAATPPVLIFGGILYFAGLAEAMRSPELIAWMMIAFAVPLWAADHFGRRIVTTETLGFRSAVLIGLAQALALVPGASRSGVTMTAARAVGMERPEAARFSMLMSVPVIAAFGLVAVIELARGADTGASLMDGLIIAVLSFAAAYAAIAFLMRFVAKIGFLPFVIYRFALGAAILIWLV
ncbi:undecaprenyl-diphosphate phosphatase [Alkalicaulis satelles]|uniref:Undecaprenyl-diphosphatase n=1 Tax=Alkalicaulis satelles TaxID=2609175 RepID=A0A5M6ZKR3_9PROT|nr:undecaprenyl-diphosphate phosphatase [Alkalicaulis satelles]KAA5803808.1 undecaprenyl-diphosphate phosphatase [Alkalicaulis satelles]